MSEEKNVTAFKIGFENFYQTVLKPRFADLENCRKKYLRYFYIATGLSFVIVPLIILYILSNYGGEGQETLKSDWVFGIILVIIVVLSTPIEIYKIKAKNNVMPELVKYFGDFKYYLQRIIDDEILAKSKLFPKYDRHYGDDFVIGRYKDVEMVISEENLGEIRYNGKHRYTKNVYSGIIVMLSMNRKFEGQIVVLKDKGIFNFTNRLQKLEKVALEDSKFEKEFEIYGSDQLEARYLLTTAFMERMLKVREAYKSNKIQFSFFDNKLLISISTRKNMFETTSLFRSCTDEKMVKQAFMQFIAIMEIIEILKLDKRLGM